MTMPHDDRITTRIWLEEAEGEDRYAAKRAYCHGFDVFRGLVGRARWVEMLYLLLRGDPPTPPQSDLLEALAVGLANPGPRDPSVHAAMCGGVAGSAAAASLMAALAVGAGREGGARDVFVAMRAWEACNADPDAWPDLLAEIAGEPGGDVWLPAAHPPGFDPHAERTPTTVADFLARLGGFAETPRLKWLIEHLPRLEARFGKGLSPAGIAAAAYADLGFTAAQGEMLYLLLRLPGALAHALEQGEFGFTRFPFGAVALEAGVPFWREAAR